MLRPTVLSLILAGLFACGGRGAERAVVIPAEYRGQTAALAADGAAAWLPDDTLIALAARSPRALADAFGFPDILRSYRALGAEEGSLYEDAAGAVSQVFGADLLRPDELSRVGIDADAPIGLALIDGERVAVALFATVADRDRLELAVHGSLTKAIGPFDPKTMGSALTLTPARAPRFALILRDSYVIFLVPGDRDDLAPLTARLALGRGEGTLAGDPSFSGAFEGFDFGADVAGYFGLPTLARRIERQRARFGIDARDGEARFARDVLAPLGGVAFGVAFDGPALRLRFAARPRPGSLPERLLRPGAGPPALLSAHPAPPLLALAAHTDPEALLSFVDALLGAGGDGLGELSALLGEHAGIDFDAEVRPLLSGELGFASHGDPAQELGQSYLFGIGDAPAAGALLGRAAAGPLARFSRTGPATTGLTLPTGGDAQVHLDLAGGQLVLSDDIAVAARVASGAAGFATRLPEPARRRLEDPRAAAVLFVEPTALAWWLGAWTYRYSRAVSARAVEAGDERALALERELGELDRRIWRAHEELSRAWAMATTRRLGATVLSVHQHDGAIVAVGLTLAPAEPGPALQGLLELATPNLVMRRVQRPAEIEEIERRLDALEEESRALQRALEDHASSRARDEAPLPPP